MKSTMKKPKPVYAPHSNIDVTLDELDRRQRKYNRLINLGIDPTLLVDDTEERENPYLVEAMIIINQDKDVPQELIDKINMFNQSVSSKEGLNNKVVDNKNI